MFQHFRGYHKRPFHPDDEKKSHKVFCENYFAKYRNLIKKLNESRSALENDLKEFRVTYDIIVNGWRKKEACKLAGLCLKAKGVVKLISEREAFLVKIHEKKNLNDFDQEFKIWYQLDRVYVECTFVRLVRMTQIYFCHGPCKR